MSDYEKRGYLRQDFRMFHLSDSPKKEYDYHYHDFNKIFILIKGDVTYYIEGKTYVLKPYDIVLVKAGDVHRPIVDTGSDYERIIIYISAEFLRTYKQQNYDLGHCFSDSVSNKSDVLRIPSMKTSKLYQVCRELELSFQDSDFACELYRNLLFLEFMVHLNRAVLHDSLTFMNTVSANEKILSVFEYLNNHLTEDFSIDRLAGQFFISKYYLMHSFKEETGYTIGGYLTMKRLLYARELIADGMPITQACLECGFKDYSTFSRSYKKTFGMSPTRQKHLAGLELPSQD